MSQSSVIQISHRGNIFVDGGSWENNPDYILEALSQGFDVEIDVWKLGGSWYLGHDKPTYQIGFSFLREPKLWCHTKNIKALLDLSHIKYINCFWHDRDICCLTSHGYIWSFPDCEMTAKSIIFFPRGIEIYKPELCAGVCCDNIGDLKC